MVNDAVLDEDSRLLLETVGRVGTQLGNQIALFVALDADQTKERQSSLPANTWSGTRNKRGL